MSFDLVTTPIHKGITRLEASAGTGKTFALAGLFLRLLLEFNVPATKILVVTYTKAATAELRDRIRRRLREAQLAFHGRPTDDALLRSLLSRVNPGDALPSLNLALELIDEISIDTIHAFCQRTLQEQAFESGVLFDMELVPDQDDLMQELAADYFRAQIYPLDPPLAAAALAKGITPDTLARMLKQFVPYPDLRLEPSQPGPTPEAIARDMRARLIDLAAIVPSLAAAPQSIVDFFLASPRWTTGAHHKPECIRDALEKIHAVLQPDAASISMWDGIGFFSAAGIDAGTGSQGKIKKQRPKLEPPLLAICDSLEQQASALAQAHQLAFLRWASQEMRVRKEQAKQQSYDDLIGGLATALRGGSGDALARAVRDKYQAALIDEFQDTDPQQWEIFHRVFGQGRDRWLFLIGDPKQAIYGFRGADVSTYVRAAGSADHKHDLDTNYRSESGLVRAINTVFTWAGKQTVFLENGISFEEVKPAGKADEAPFTLDGKHPPPLQVWCWKPAKSPVGIREAFEQLPVSVAAEISRLLSNPSCRLKDRLRPRDIAVLVESHRQGGSIKEALHALGIPAVELATSSVLATDEARELHWILAGILEPGRENAVKSALTTNALGWTADRLLEETADQEKWQHALQRFAGYRESWMRDGFFAMFSRLLRDEKIIENLLRFADGERRITNLLHLAELLESAAKDRHMAPAQLLQWIEARRLDADTAPEEYQLRLESDEDAVRIVTIHASKGLEYPVVFCPFLQKDAGLKPIKQNGTTVISEVIQYHDAGSYQRVWDLGLPPAPDGRQRAKRENLAEKMRLLYVALTRAQHRCYLVSAAYHQKNSTPLAWLLQTNKSGAGDPVQALDDNKPEAGEWKSLWNAIAAAAVNPRTGQSPIAVDDLPTEAGQAWIPDSLQTDTGGPRSCQRTGIHPSWYLSSFSQLSSRILSKQAVLETDEPGHDEPPAVMDLSTESGPVDPPSGIFALPGGARTGECLHQILERFDFGSPTASPANAGLVSATMEAYGFFDDSHRAAVSDMLDRLRMTSLDRDNPDFTLSRIPAGHRLAELEFHLPAAACDGARLIHAIRNPASAGQSATVRSSSPAQCHSFLKGFIDLVLKFEDRFYVLDWKSNRLGNRIEDYHETAMEQAIAESFYDLQYHLYTLALDKYLRLRLPDYDFEKHYGGVRYVFLRGVTPERPELAIHRTRPTRSTMEELARILAAGGPVA